MMHKEKYSLKWYTYSEHLSSMMNELMMNEDFSDVTLVTEDKEQIKANIHILSICSPVFHNILKKEKNSNQILYLRGVQYSEMKSIMQFIYLGQATIYKERIDEFLAVAKSLEIKELCNTETGTNIKLKDELSSSDPVTLSENIQLARWDVKYACDQCDYQDARKSELTKHIQSKHEGVRYACGQCDYQATIPDNLSTHLKSMHEEMKYGCDHCDYQAITQRKVTLHIQSKHENKHACDQCDYQATYRSDLTRHIQSKHEGVIYACDQCNYSASWKNMINSHKRVKHINHRQQLEDPPSPDVSRREIARDEIACEETPQPNSKAASKRDNPWKVKCRECLNKYGNCNICIC